MRKVLAVIRREFFERVRTKWFLFSTILGPVFMIGTAVLPSVLATRGGKPTAIALVDEGAGSLAQRLQAQLSRGGRFVVTRVSVATEAESAAVDSLTRAVQAQQLEGFLSINGTTLESGSAEYRGRNVASLRDMALLESAVRQSIMVERLTRQGIDPSMVQEAQARISLTTLRITRRGATGETGMATFALAYIVGFVLYMAIILYGVNVMRSVLEEKQTRIIEVLVSSMKPFQLLMGKVVGVGAVGLLQFGIWAAAAWGMVRYKTRLLGLLGISDQAAAAVQFPAVGTAMIAVAVGYFLLGYMLYSAMFAMVGASVNTDSEAQQAQMPVMMLLIVSIIMFPAILNEPGGRMAVWMSLIPFSAPIIMPIRWAASEVPLPELAASLGLALGTCVLVTWVSSRIYRIGILMYGKRPSLKEMAHWARQS